MIGPGYIMHFAGVFCCRQEGNIATIATSVFFKLPYTLSPHEASEIKKLLQLHHINLMLPLFVVRKVFEGNSDHNTVVRHILNQPFITKQVTIRPKKVKGSTGLRMELYGCKLGKISFLFVCLFFFFSVIQSLDIG